MKSLDRDWVRMCPYSVVTEKTTNFGIANVDGGNARHKMKRTMEKRMICTENHMELTGQMSLAGGGGA